MAATEAHRVRVRFVTPLATAAGAWEARDAWIVALREDGRRGIGESGVDDAGWAAALDAARLDLDRVPPARPWVGVNATIGAVDADAAVEAATRAVAAGFRTLKLKAAAAETVGSLAGRLRAVREAVGPDVALRLDANGTWDAAGAAERLAAIEPAGLEYVEQPLRAGDLSGMAALRRRTCIPLAADEGVTSVHAARAVLDAGAADVLVAKPGRVGGPTGVARIAALAAVRAVPVVVSSLFETGIGLAAALASAAALPDVPGWPAAARDHGLATAGLLEDDLILEPFLVERGRMRAPYGPGCGGLGVTLDEGALARHRVTPE